MAYERNYFHPSKHVPWGGDGGVSITVIGEDLSAATFVWAFAASVGASPLITLGNAAAGSQGVSATYDPDYIHPDRRVVVGATTIVPLITEATLEALTYPTAPANLVLAHDLLLTPSGGQQRVICYGEMTIRQGVGD